MDLFKNIRASLFNDDLSNEPPFSQIRLAGQYLHFTYNGMTIFSRFYEVNQT